MKLAEITRDLNFPCVVGRVPVLNLTPWKRPVCSPIYYVGSFSFVYVRGPARFVTRVSSLYNWTTLLKELLGLSSVVHHKIIAID